MTSKPAPELDLTLDPTLLADLRRIGAEFENRRAPVRPAAALAGRRGRSRSMGRRSVVVLLLAGCTATGAWVATRPRTPDPIVSVIPKNLKVTDLAWIEIGSPDDGAPSEVSLMTVDGIDAVVTRFRGDSSRVKNAAEDEFVVGGVPVFVSKWSSPGFSDRTSARWGLADGTSYSAHVRSEPKSSRPSVERLVLQLLSPNAAASTAEGGITEVARWTEDRSRVVYHLRGSLVQTDSSGVTRVARANQASGSGFFATLRSDIPEGLLPRVDSVRQPWTGSRFRSGGYVFEGNASKDGLRPLRRSELRRLIKQVDRARAAEIAKPFWKGLSKDLEYSDALGPALCVRSRTDVACGQYRLSRLVGKTWVYATMPDTRDVLVDGRAVRGFHFVYSGFTLYVLPEDAQSVQERFPHPNGTVFTATSKRPEI